MPSSEYAQRFLGLVVMVGILGIILGLCTTPLSARTLISLLEQRFPRADVGNGQDIAGVIALGGNPDRIREAARLAQLYPHLNIVVTGAGRRAEILSLVGPHISPDRVVVEEAAQNTYENAALSSRMVGMISGSKWLLVTSASHMPRAMGTFRKVGFDVLPWPIFDLTRLGVPIGGIVRHEMLGLIAYWALGRSNALWPASATRSNRSTSLARVQRWQPRKSDGTAG